MPSPTNSERNDSYLRKMELTDEYVKLHQKLQEELDLANLCISKAKTTHGITLFSVNSYDSHDLEPSIRIDVENGKFELVKEKEAEEKGENKETEAVEEELKNKNSGDSEDVEEEKRSPYAGQFRPFGVLESTAAKDSRKIMKSAITTLLAMATTQQEIVRKTRELTENF